MKRSKNERKIDIARRRWSGYAENERLTSENEFLKKIVLVDSMSIDRLSEVSHEMKTPANVILSAIQMLEQDLEQEISVELIEKYLKIIKQNTQRIVKNVENVVAYSRIQSGYEKMQYTDENMVELLRETVESVEPLAQKKGIVLEFRSEMDSKYMACDRGKTETILLNLLSNAIKATSYGGKITIQVEVLGEELSFSVIDTGCGIPQEQAESIFSRYVSLDNVQEQKYMVSGIGLTLVKSLVEMHEGNITLQSGVGQGTCVKIDLPIWLCGEASFYRALKDAGVYNQARIDMAFADME